MILHFHDNPPPVFFALFLPEQDPVRSHRPHHRGRRLQRLTRSTRARVLHVLLLQVRGFTFLVVFCSEKSQRYELIHT